LQFRGLSQKSSKPYAICVPSAGKDDALGKVPRQPRREAGDRRPSRDSLRCLLHVAAGSWHSQAERHEPASIDHLLFVGLLSSENMPLMMCAP
jgi:hypothetical protein